ncbi:DUF6783 domain-containing protein [Blautia pseudococcoides]|uniref:DUF6783 domain-containing protein n=1 Tax=Blautia pseudococcoides TaxID=1796616 RepID=UPI00351160AE
MFENGQRSPLRLPHRSQISHHIEQSSISIKCDAQLAESNFQTHSSLPTDRLVFLFQYESWFPAYK